MALQISSRSLAKLILQDPKSGRIVHQAPQSEMSGLVLQKGSAAGQSISSSSGPYSFPGAVATGFLVRWGSGGTQQQTGLVINFLAWVQWWNRLQSPQKLYTNFPVQWAHHLSSTEEA